MSAQVSLPSRAFSLEDKLAFLRIPQNYPARPRHVEERETHMSYVFLTDTDAYKLKKPVRYPFLDFSTLAAREASCRAEVQLNQRLTIGIYRGVLAMTCDGDGRLQLGGHGKVVDWLVHMRRLPDARMLDRLIVERRLQVQDLAPLAARLAGFYAAQPRLEITPQDFVAELEREHRLNVELLRQPRFELNRSELDTIDAMIRRFLGPERERLQARVIAGRVVEGHGDLRPEHVCLTDPPQVIDCLEFNRALRLVDWADEIAFLGLECALLGAPWVGNALRASVEARLHDAVAPELTDFYTALRACLRARLAVAHLLEPAPRDGARWLPRARDYLRCAATHSARSQH